MNKIPKNTPAKARLLDKAQELMQSKGFSATTIDEICRKAGLTKGSFFYYFHSKEDLAKQTLDNFVNIGRKLAEKSGFQKETDPLQRVYSYVDFIIKSAKHPVLKRGCLLGNFSQELSATHPGIRSICVQYFSEWAEGFKNDIEKARVYYKPKALFDPGSLAVQLIVTLEGSLILAKATQDMGVVEKSLRHYKKYLQYLFEG